jgi:hypothetical protein
MLPKVAVSVFLICLIPLIYSAAFAVLTSPVGELDGDTIEVLHHHLNASASGVSIALKSGSIHAHSLVLALAQRDDLVHAEYRYASRRDPQPAMAGCGFCARSPDGDTE